MRPITLTSVMPFRILAYFVTLFGVERKIIGKIIKQN
jgi:hypothetical protein